MSRVGEDPFIHYLSEEEVNDSPMWTRILENANEKGFEGTVNEKIASYLGEIGTVTGRPRKIGSFDFELAKYSSKINGATNICITCLDKLFPENLGVTSYDKLSQDAIDHVNAIEEAVGVKATLISTGPDVNDVVDIRDGL